MNVEGDLRNLEFLEKVYGDRLEVTWRGLCACGCGSVRYRGSVRDPCPSLVGSNGKYECRDYGNRPEWCREFNCATWAIVSGHKETDYTRLAAKAMLESRATAAATP
jgi:Fe-S-cluster containining protein